MSPTNDSTRDPGYAKLLTARSVNRAIGGVLRRNGWPKEELEDGLGDVRVKVVAAIARGAPPPATVRKMRAFCAKIARDLAIDRLRKKATEQEWCDGLCEDPDEYAPILPSGEQRDPVDAARQLEVAAELFREGRMPQDGVEILEGIASGCTFGEVGKELGITDRAVEGRLKTMRTRFREQIDARRMG